jgi:hypothetical protein
MRVTGGEALPLVLKPRFYPTLMSKLKLRPRLPAFVTWLLVETEEQVRKSAKVLRSKSQVQRATMEYPAARQNIPGAYVRRFSHSVSIKPICRV